MLAIRERAMDYLNEVPEEKLPSVIDYMRFVSEPPHPYEVTTKEEFYRKIEAGLDDMRQGRTRPADEAFTDIRQKLAKYGV